MSRIQNPVIVLPGITATTLHDDYPLKIDNLWTTVLNAEFERIQLHPDDFRFEAVEPARVRPGRLFGIAYDDLIKSLRYDLSRRADQPTPVFAFPYDWRQKLASIGEDLHEFVEEVIARTKLLPHYAGYERNPQVDLVAHSMGGLVVCEYLHQFGPKKRIGKVATVGTPYQGSLEAVVKLVTGMGILSGAVPSEREREASRSIPSLYHLLPSYSGAVRSTEGRQRSLSVETNWQSGILDSLAEYVRLHSLKAGTASVNRDLAGRLLRSMLTEAHAHRKRVEDLSLAAAGLKSDDWLVVVGGDYRTRVEMGLDVSTDPPRFSISDDQHVNEWDADGDSRRTGDGTVPLDGAIAPFLNESAHVMVRPSDFGWLEWKDLATMYGVTGLHAMLPNMNLVQRLVLRHLYQDYRGAVSGLPLPGISPAAWNPPISELQS